MSAESPLTKSIALLVPVTAVASFLAPELVNIFTLIPQNTIVTHFYVWNLITASFFEPRFIPAVVLAGMFLFFGDSVEPYWGSTRLFKFIIFVNVGTSIATFFTAYICYVLQMQWLMSQYYSGLGSLVGALAVALRQIRADGEVSIGSVSVRSRYLPMIIAIFGVLIDVITRYGPSAQAEKGATGIALPGSQIPWLLYGIYIGWIYLRFFDINPDRQPPGQTDSDQPILGDVSDSFGFAAMFPDPIRLPIAALSNLVYNIFWSVGCCSVWHSQRHAHSLYEASSGRSLPAPPPPDGDDDIARRRRQLARERLDARLALQSNRRSNESYELDGGVIV